MATGDNAATLQGLGTAKRALATSKGNVPKNAVEANFVTLIGTGNAALTAFSVPHGVVNAAGVATAPKDIIGSPRNAASAALHWFTFDATNATVNFVAAPANAADVSFAVLAIV